MTDKQLAETFQASRAHLRTVAHRLLGSWNEADDAVQEAWLRLANADSDGIDNLRGWLTTVVARICLDMLRSRKARPEWPLDADVEQVAGGPEADAEALMADSVGVAMLVVLERLTPHERVAFVLHDVFGLSFEQIALILCRSPLAARQLAGRARRRVHAGSASGHADRDADRARQQQVVEAFLAASRTGDLSALLAVLDPKVVVRADAVAVAASRARPGAPHLVPEIRGCEAVAQTFRGRAQAAQLAMVNGDPGLVFAPAGQPFAVFEFAVENGRIVAINLVGDPMTINGLQLEF